MKTKEETIDEARILINRLISEGYSNYKIAKDTGISEKTIGNYVRKINKPSYTNAKVLLQFYANEGSMLKGETPSTLSEEPYHTTSAGIKFFQRSGGKFIMRVPIVPVYAYAKYIDEFRDANIWDGDGYFDFPVDQVYHGSYQAFEIKGDSMDDDSKRSLSHGDIVLGRELNQNLWKSKLHTDRFPNWIIVLDDTILCKQIIEQDLNTGDIVCHSLNSSPEYTDFTINLNKVRKLFNIVQRVSSSF